jgi:replicative DNA helicase
LDLRFIENIIIKSALIDKHYLALISTTLEETFFDDPAAKEVFKFTSSHFNEYGQIPQRDMIVNSAEDDNLKNDIRLFFEDIDAIDFSVSEQFQFLVDRTEVWLKDKAVKQAILKSVDIIDKEDQEEYGEVRNYVEEALSKSIKVDLGLDYFTQLGERLTRISQSADIRVPSYYPILDEYISGGFPPYTLSVFVAAIHGFKSNMLANMAARQVMAGHNVFLLTLEMSEDAFAQRFDSIYSKLDINRIYQSSDYMRNLMDELRTIKRTEGRGNLYIKQFPTGAASVDDFRIYIREMGIRGIKPSIIFVDYINLMKAATRAGDNLYTAVKRIAEELRALGFEFVVPIISVSQLNREGMFVEFDELSFTYIAESIGVPATADFMCVFGTDEDKLVYENEVHYKIIKNRLGGRVGESDKLYYDARNLRMYDASEETMWHEDAGISGDRRSAHEPEQPRETQRGRRRTRR